ncbi:hypothetical protein GCM10010972_34320 [Cellulomonas carbonis]|nr:hypothetical protein GCM10010972_34320 [Cellulomonas carbonis]
MARALFPHAHPGSEGAWDAPREFGKGAWRSKARAALAAARHTSEAGVRARTRRGRRCGLRPSRRTGGTTSRSMRKAVTGPTTTRTSSVIVRVCCTDR